MAPRANPGTTNRVATATNAVKSALNKEFVVMQQASGAVRTLLDEFTVTPRLISGSLRA